MQVEFMKVTKTIFVAFCLALFSVNIAMAEEHALPEPDAAAARGATATSTTAKPPNPPGVPIDNNLLILTMSALVLGTVVIYKNEIKKASV